MVNNQISVAPRKRRGAIIWIIVGILVLILGFGGCSSYNSMNSLSHDVDQAWAQVQVQYQRRSDLIPNLVNTVKGYASHESEVFQKVTAARAGLLSADEAAKQVANTEAPVNQEQLQGYMNRQEQLQKAMGLYINAVREAYPDLKANTQFLDLHAQIPSFSCHPTGNPYLNAQTTGPSARPFLVSSIFVFQVVPPLPAFL